MDQLRFDLVSFDLELEPLLLLDVEVDVDPENDFDMDVDIPDFDIEYDIDMDTDLEQLPDRHLNLDPELPSCALAASETSRKTNVNETSNNTTAHSRIATVIFRTLLSQYSTRLSTVNSRRSGS